MSQPSGSIHEIRWHELCPWLVLVKALRVSLLVRVLLLALAGSWLTHWGWSACESLSRTSEAKLPSHAGLSQPGIFDLRELKAAERRLLASSLFHVDSPRDGITIVISDVSEFDWIRKLWLKHRIGPLIEGWTWLSSPIVRVFQMRATPMRIVQLLFCGGWAIVVWGIFGGAIARISAKYLTREEIMGPLSALQAAASKWLSTAGAPTIVLLFAAAMTCPLAIMGFLIRANFLAMIAGILWGLYLVWGIVLAIVLGALWFGWPLMWATIAVERSDAFDAASRTAAYIYQRPVRLVFYIFVATVLGIFGQLVVSGFVFAGNHLTDWGVSWGAGVERTADLSTFPSDADLRSTLTGTGSIAVRSIRFWKSALASVASAYPLAYLFSASVGIYLLLRLHVDATEMDEIVIDPGEERREMPELEEHSSGVSNITERAPDDLSTRGDISLEKTDD